MAIAAQLVLGAPPALGQALPPDPARLDYQRPPTLTTCPDEEYFRASVSSHLGAQDPFTATAPRRITLALHHQKDGAFIAKLDMYDQAGAHLGENDPLSGPDCAQVVEHAGDVVASWLVPLKRPTTTHAPTVVAPVATPAPLAPAAPKAVPTPPPGAAWPWEGPYGGLRMGMWFPGSGWATAGFLSLGNLIEEINSAKAATIMEQQATGGKSACSPKVTARALPAFTCSTLLMNWQQVDTEAKTTALFLGLGLPLLVLGALFPWERTIPGHDYGTIGPSWFKLKLGPMVP